MKRIAIVLALGTLLCVPNFAWTANVDASILGRGFTPDLNKIQELAAKTSSRPLKDGASNLTSFGLVASSTDFERVLQADMSVAAAGTGWGASVKASLTKEHRENRKRITFAATQQVVRGTVTLDSPIALTGAAKQMLASDPIKYVAAYGTSVVDSVDLGGSAVFLFTFSFASEEDAMRFALDSEGSYGAAKGSLKINIRELLTRASNNVSVSGFVTGTTKAPSFFGNVNGARSEFYSAKYSEEMLQKILEYVDGFEKTITESNLEQLSQVGFTHRHLSNLADADLSPRAVGIFRDVEGFARALNDSLDVADHQRYAILQMTTVFKDRNTEKNLSAASVLDGQLKSAESSLRDLRDSLATWGTVDKQKLSQVAIPKLPRTFCTALATEISPAATPRFDTGNPQNRPSSPPRKWRTLTLTPKNKDVTYTIVPKISMGHSRSEPGCNYGHMELYARTLAATATPSSVPEIGTWSTPAAKQLGDGYELIHSTGEVSVCRRQPDRLLEFRPFSFTAGDVRDVRLLYSNWDDTVWTTSAVQVFRCGQPDSKTGLRSDLVR
jgi:hypothetical protein